MFAAISKTLPRAKSLASVKRQIQDLGISGNSVPIDSVRPSNFDENHGCKMFNKT
jgi:hypothetical protein